jgi:Mce-associated membrane protein
VEQADATPSWGGPRAGHRAAAPAVAVPALAALVVLAVVAVVLAALVGLRVSDHNRGNDASTAALAAATTGVASVLSYNYRSLDADFTKAEALLTPSFRKAYVSTTAKAVQPLAAKYKAVSTAQVSAAGVIGASGSKATVLVFVSQQVTNTQLSAPRLDRSRIQVDLVKTGGHWLINKLTPL